MRTFWSQVQKEGKKRPKRLAFAVGLLLALPLGGYGYWQYYQDIVPHSGTASIDLRTHDTTRRDATRHDATRRAHGAHRTRRRN
jgi:hypothetical protein